MFEGPQFVIRKGKHDGNDDGKPFAFGIKIEIELARASPNLSLQTEVTIFKLEL